MSDLIPYSLNFDTSILTSQLGASSIAMYARDFKAYLAYAGTPAIALQSSTLARWRTELANTTTMSPNTINRMLSAVKRMMIEGAAQGYISHEIAESFRHVENVRIAALKDRLRKTNKVKIEPELMRKIINSFDVNTLVGLRNKAMFTALASSGLRIHELATLQYSQIIKRDRGYLLIIHKEQGKNLTEDREANISIEAVNAIDAWLKERPVQSEYIFTSFEVKGDSKPLTKPISSVGAWKVIKRVFEKRGLLGVKPHDLRRFVATQLIREKGFPTAQRSLGHKSPATTAMYDMNEIELGVTDNLF
jgi:integrase